MVGRQLSGTEIGISLKGGRYDIEQILYHRQVCKTISESGGKDIGRRRRAYVGKFLLPLIELITGRNSQSYRIDRRLRAAAALDCAIAVTAIGSAYVKFTAHRTFKRLAQALVTHR